VTRKGARAVVVDAADPLSGAIMGKPVKKAAAKPARGNKAATKKPSAAKKAAPARKPAPSRRPGKPARLPRSGAGAKPAKSVPPKPSAPQTSKPVVGAPAIAPAAPAISEAPRATVPRPVVPPMAPLQPPPGPKPQLVRLSSLEPAAAERLSRVRALLEAQTRHDLPGVLACFAPEPTLEFAGGPRHVGQERVGQIYGDLLRAFPDLALEVLAEHVADRSVIIELVMQGSHRQQWLGMAPRGRPLNLPVCSVYLFDKRDQISAVRVYLDRNLAIVQLTSGLLR